MSGDESVRLLSADEIRARRRPGAVILLWGFQLAWALVVATPAYLWTKGTWGAHPDGDLVLFEPGARALFFWLGARDATLALVVQVTAGLALVGVLLGQLPLAIAFASLALGRGEAGLAPRGSAGSAVSAGAAVFGPFFAVVVVAMLVQGALAFGGAFASSAASGLLAQRIGDRPASVITLFVIALFVLLVFLVSAFADLVRAAIVRDALPAPATSALGALLRGARAVVSLSRKVKRRALFAWASREAAGMALLAGGAMIAHVLGGRGLAALVGLWLVHQAIALARAALRASWLARALRAVAAAP